MHNPTCYIWQSDDISEADLQNTKELCRRLNIRTVIFRVNSKSPNIHQGLQGIIQNHLQGRQQNI